MIKWIMNYIEDRQCRALLEERKAGYGWAWTALHLEGLTLQEIEEHADMVDDGNARDMQFRKGILFACMDMRKLGVRSDVAIR